MTGVGPSPAAVDHLIATRLLGAPQEVVWRALTTPEHISTFWGGHHATVPVDSVDLDLRVGGGFALTTVGSTGRRHRLRFTYLEIAEPRRLVLSEPETGIITNIDLVPQGGQTFLTIHQRRVPPELTGEAARRGLAGILAKLDDLVAGLSARKHKGDPVSPQKTIVESYMEGFRRGDHGAILDCLTDDVTWLIAGFTTKHGKEAFEGEILNENFEGRPALAVNRVVEEGNTVVAIGEGRATHRTQGEFRFAFSDVFLFRERLIERVESYITPLGQQNP